MNGSLMAQQVAAEVERIRGMAGEPEAAHGAEDALYRRVLEAIARVEVFGDEAVRCAQYALFTSQLDFPRWCA